MTTIHGNRQCDNSVTRCELCSSNTFDPPTSQAEGHLATMDRLESLSNTLQNITMYDIKSMYNQVCPYLLRVSTTKFADDLDSSGEECRLEYQ